MFNGSNGEYYIGEWFKDSKDGSGIQNVKDEYSYEGSFQNGFFNGNGTFIDLDSHTKYVGNFKGGKEEGFGTLYSSDGQQLKQGYWKNGIFGN